MGQGRARRAGRGRGAGRRVLTLKLRWLVPLLVLAAPAALADQVEPARIAELLFPQSRSWTRLADLPAVPREAIDAYLLERLRNAISSRDAGLAETAECSFMLRGFAG